MTDPADEAARHLARNAVEALPGGALARQLREGRPLRVKYGIDPTAPDMHLGHTVVLRKLREFQDLGHTVVLIIGDYTARVGDPSGRSATRPLISGEEIDLNAETFQHQAFTVLDPDRTEVRRNSEWLDMAMEELFRLASTSTVAQILERDDFAKRHAAREPISILELLYPLLQGYDSVQVASDVEIGGTDQKFNFLFARDVQQAYGVPLQSILTLPILPGLDGVQRMSKSAGNYVGVTEPPEEAFGKLMSVPDSAMATYHDLLLDEPLDLSLPPRDAKRAMAGALTARLHGEDAAREARERFDRVHVRHEAPEEIEEAEIPGGGESVHLPAVLRDAFGVSASEARRLLAQGGVKLDGATLDGDDIDLPASRLDGAVLQLGKRRFRRIRIVCDRAGIAPSQRYTLLSPDEEDHQGDAQDVGAVVRRSRKPWASPARGLHHLRERWMRWSPRLEGAAVFENSAACATRALRSSKSRPGSTRSPGPCGPGRGLN